MITFQVLFITKDANFYDWYQKKSKMQNDLQRYTKEDADNSQEIFDGIQMCTELNIGQTSQLRRQLYSRYLTGME